MRVPELASLLVTADEAERSALLRANAALATVPLARALKDICLEGWDTSPEQALGAAAALQALFNYAANSETGALELWTRGLAALVQGQMETAVGLLDQSQSQFLVLGKDHDAAATQVSKLVALAMLGHYEQAVACGLRAREVFLAHGDLLHAGKIEHNVGNIYFRRDQYDQAEKFQKLSRQHFQEVDDADHLTKIENSLALTLAQQHKLREAEQLYEQALQRAESANQLSTQAAIESSIGTMALYQGRYDRALDYLERSRRNYARLGMIHLSALTESEIADAYLELNLIPEAAQIYDRVTKTFADLGMRADEARSLVYHARAAGILGQTENAQKRLARAAELFAQEGNEVGQALAKLTQAHLLYEQHRWREARQFASLAEPAFAAAGAKRRLLFARWLQGETARRDGLTTDALKILKQALDESETEQPDLAARCLTSLGLLAAATGVGVAARESLTRAISITEELRAPLPAEEFRTSFFADKLTPYQEMVRLCLDDGSVAEAFEYAERARGRALFDSLPENAFSSDAATDEFESALLRKLESLRQELNYFYRQADDASRNGGANRSSYELKHREIRAREDEVLEITRQLQHRRPEVSDHARSFDLTQLQEQLVGDTTIIEYGTIDDEMIAFIVTCDSVKVVRNLARESEVAHEISQLRFQIDALRFGAASIRRHLGRLTERTNQHLAALYSMLWAPLAEEVEGARLVIVPQRTLHYLPFQALYDGAEHLIEKFEISYAPSAAVFGQCLTRPRKQIERALLVGVPDETISHVTDEINGLKVLFSQVTTLMDRDATVQALQRSTAGADVVHLACHARFRSDNPLFSSLHLADGGFNVRDAYQLRLNCDLVTLSACETGVNVIMPGDELIGLARGFFAAGSSSVLLSLWTVDDKATRIVMENFYRAWLMTGSMSGALRSAQMQLLKESPHPFFWAPFVLTGRG